MLIESPQTHHSGHGAAQTQAPPPSLNAGTGTGHDED